MGPVRPPNKHENVRVEVPNDIHKSTHICKLVVYLLKNIGEPAQIGYIKLQYYHVLFLKKLLFRDDKSPVVLDGGRVPGTKASPIISWHNLTR